MTGGEGADVIGAKIGFSPGAQAESKRARETCRAFYCCHLQCLFTNAEGGLGHQSSRGIGSYHWTDGTMHNTGSTRNYETHAKH